MIREGKLPQPGKAIQSTLKYRQTKKTRKPLVRPGMLRKPYSSIKSSKKHSRGLLYTKFGKRTWSQRQPKGNYPQQPEGNVPQQNIQQQKPEKNREPVVVENPRVDDTIGQQGEKSLKNIKRKMKEDVKKIHEAQEGSMHEDTFKPKP